MGKRQTSWLDDIFELLQHTPIWVGPVFALVAFGVIHQIVPHLLPTRSGPVDITPLSTQLVPLLAWFAAGAILLTWAAAEIHKLRNRALLERQTCIASIKNISWQQFEQLVAEAYRRQGYLAEVVGTAYGDGGVDIRLTGHGEMVLVQCKQWRAYKVGVNTIREMLGVVVSQRAARGIVITSGLFTNEARRFAEANQSIKLIDGTALIELVRSVQSSPVHRVDESPRSQSPPVAHDMQAPSCPSCGSGMVMRTARKGRNAGSQFWGCQKYPACRGIRQIA